MSVRASNDRRWLSRHGSGLLVLVWLLVSTFVLAGNLAGGIAVLLAGVAVEIWKASRASTAARCPGRIEPTARLR